MIKTDRKWLLKNKKHRHTIFGPMDHARLLHENFKRFIDASTGAEGDSIQIWLERPNMVYI